MDTQELRRNFGNRMWEIMELKGITVKDIVEKTGLAPRTVHKMLSGWFPSVEKVVLVAEALGVETSVLLGENELPTKEQIFERDVEGYMRLTGRSRKAALWDRKLIRWKETEKEI